VRRGELDEKTSDFVPYFTRVACGVVQNQGFDGEEMLPSSSSSSPPPPERELLSDAAGNLNWQGFDLDSEFIFHPLHSVFVWKLVRAD
jgi:hypothetical protein